MTVWRWATGAVLVSAVVIWSCSGAGSGDVSVQTDPNNPRLDAGTTPTIDAGTDNDAGTTDAGTTDGGTDGGTTDGGTAWVPPPPVPFPSPAPADWAFYGPQNGGPHDVFGVSADQGGNIWVAGGEDGLFLMRAGTTTFVRYTMADGLRPYGYMPDGSDPVGPKFLKVISVAGGPANTAFVGYEGRNRNAKGGLDCEGNWDSPAVRDPSIYKSGDADRVTVDASGKLTVVHYDIFSGPGIVGNEPAGREKLCHVLRIVWNPATNDVWFGGNHGFAWGNGTYAGNPKCNGQLACSGLVEHSHPAINGPNNQYLTGDYRGVAIDPVTHDVWFGGIVRTTRFHWGAFPNSSPASRFFGAGAYTEGFNDNLNPPACPSPETTPCYIHNRIDVWKDALGEGFFPPQQSRTDDDVFGIAAVGDSSVYVGSGYLGLRHIDAFGNLISDETARIASAKRDASGNIVGGFVGALATDPRDASIWVGNRFAGGVDRLNAPGGDQRFSINTFGGLLANMGIEDVQFDTSGPTRKVLVGFHQSSTTAGFVAVYSGN